MPFERFTSYERRSSKNIQKQYQAKFKFQVTFWSTNVSMDNPTWIYNIVSMMLLIEEILHHLGYKDILVNNGINYQPQLVNAGFLNHQQYVSKLNIQNFPVSPVFFWWIFGARGLCKWRASRIIEGVKRPIGQLKTPVLFRVCRGGLWWVYRELYRGLIEVYYRVMWGLLSKTIVKIPY